MADLLYIKYIKQCTIYLLKKTLYLVYLFSNTKIYCFFIFFVIIAFYSRVGDNILVTFCSFSVTFLLTSSSLLCVLLNISPFFSLFEKVVGASFLNNHFPATFYGLRCVYPVAVFLFTIVLIASIEGFTATFVYSFDTEHLDGMKQESRRLLDSGEVGKAVENEIKVMDEYQRTLSKEGFFRKVLNDPKSVKFIDFFAVKR